MDRNTVRITVLKCMDNRRVQETERIGGASGPCEAFRAGQSFIAGWEIPEGFCTFAWADIHNDIKLIQCGGNPPHIKQDHTTIVCCKDGLCPVVFCIERIQLDEIERTHETMR